MFYTQVNLVNFLCRYRQCPYPRVTPIGENKIVVHISTAMALNKVLMMMQCEDQSPDVFRFLLEESCNIFGSVPTSVYTVYFFDVANGLPNSSPNDLKPVSVQVYGETGQCVF